jgi:putative component of membrane protein insertase Oxa1/YidC/SpoIIIJ protein YidD
MKTLLILLIKFYWFIIPESKRRRCIFRTSCSQHVYQTTKKEGFYKGLMAFKYRFLNCRGGHHLLENPIDGHKIMVLPNGQVLTETEISERFIK